jgi:hypothetical protein
MASPRPPSQALRNVLIIVVAAVAVAAVAIVAEIRSSHLFVTVTSNHVSNTIAYVLTIDGRQVDSGVLLAGGGAEYSVPLTWFVDDCQSHTVVATSTGGGLGPETDSESGIVCSGVPATVSLSV